METAGENPNSEIITKESFNKIIHDLYKKVKNDKFTCSFEIQRHLSYLESYFKESIYALGKFLQGRNNKKIDGGNLFLQFMNEILICTTQNWNSEFIKHISNVMFNKFYDDLRFKEIQIQNVILTNYKFL